MRHSFSIFAATTLIALAAILSAAQNASAADKPAPVKPAATKPKSCPACEKLKALGTHLGRALDVAASLFSDNEAEFLARNQTALLSGNKPNILSGNKPNILSGNAPKVLSGNQTPIFSGNSFSLLSNIKIEIHIENSGNTVTPPPANVKPVMAGSPQPSSKEVIAPSSKQNHPPVTAY